MNRTRIFLLSLVALLVAALASTTALALTQPRPLAVNALRILCYATAPFAAGQTGYWCDSASNHVKLRKIDGTDLDATAGGGGGVTNLTTDITWSYAAGTARQVVPNAASVGNAGDDLYIYAGDGDAVGTAAGNVHINGGSSLGISNGKTYIGDVRGDVRIGDGSDTIYLLSSTYVAGAGFTGPGAPAVAGDHQGAFNLSTNDTADHIGASYTPALASTCISVWYTVQLQDIPNTTTRTAQVEFSFIKNAGNWTSTESATIITPSGSSLPSPLADTDGSIIRFHIHPAFANSYTWRGFYTIIER